MGVVSLISIFFIKNVKTTLQKHSVVYQGPNQTNQDLIKAWLKHEEPNSTTGRTR